MGRNREKPSIERVQQWQISEIKKQTSKQKHFPSSEMHSEEKVYSFSEPGVKMELN